MNITILTYGSRGDVQPFLALAVGLQKAGHPVTLAAPPRYKNFVEQQGVTFAPLAGDPDELSLLFNNAGSNVFRMVRSMQQHVLAIAPDVVRAARAATQGADLLIHGFAFTTGAHSIARELGIPDVSVQLFPVFAPTPDFPAIGMPHNAPRWLNSPSHWFSTQVFWHGGNLGYYRVRRNAPADFPRRLYWPFKPGHNRPPTPLFFAFSPVVVGKPHGWELPHIHMPGYFFLDDPQYQPPEKLRRFLEEGDAPVCITFGSMVNREAERITQTAMQAIQDTHNRAIVLSGWGGWRPDHAPEHILFLDAVPHDWLFPRCRVVVHHGGAGTTAAGLRAGTPSILVPHTADQPFWGRRVAATGAGPKPIPVSRLSADMLADALVQAGSEPVRRRAAEVGYLIRSENSVERTVTLIEDHAQSFQQHALETG
ncbi:MAG TPA: glycosyltransferase [Levilinea sp.]|nr:glycosyltransferase [Levilinea sp.]